MTDWHVRDAEDFDLAAIHSFGSNAPELSVGGVGGGFPSLDELERDDLSDWLVLEDDDGHVWGFCCARTGDADRAGGQRSACIVYLFVHEKHRRKGLARKLLDAMFFQLQCAGVSHVYTWAATPDAVKLFERERFTGGKACVWMDFDLDRSKARAPSPETGTAAVPTCVRCNGKGTVICNVMECGDPAWRQCSGPGRCVLPCPACPGSAAAAGPAPEPVKPPATCQCDYSYSATVCREPVPEGETACIYCQDVCKYPAPRTPASGTAPTCSCHLAEGGFDSWCPVHGNDGTARTQAAPRECTVQGCGRRIGDCPHGTRP